jgi:hypothetical protein
MRTIRDLNRRHTITAALIIPLMLAGCASNDGPTTQAEPDQASSSDTSASASGTTAESSGESGNSTSTGAEPTTNGGSSESDGSDPTGGESSSGDPGTVHSISGSVIRTVEPTTGHPEWVGSVTVGVFVQCLVNPFVPGNLVGGVLLSDADLSQPDAEVAYTVDGISDGTWYLLAFLDGDGDGQLGPNDISSGVCSVAVVEGGPVEDVDLAIDHIGE